MESFGRVANGPRRLVAAVARSLPLLARCIDVRAGMGARARVRVDVLRYASYVPADRLRLWAEGVAAAPVGQDQDAGGAVEDLGIGCGRGNITVESSAGWYRRGGGRPFVLPGVRLAPDASTRFEDKRLGVTYWLSIHAGAL